VEHVPVLIQVILSILEEFHLPLDRAIDATLGLGGYSHALLERSSSTRVLGVDQDGDALAFAKERLKIYGERFVSVQGNFKDILDISRKEGFLPSDALFFDLGVSNLQLTTPERGFSYQHDGPLDMRMNCSISGETTAYHVFNEYSPADLSRIFSHYGEERHAYKFAKILVAAREKTGPLETTGDVIEALRGGLSPSFMRKLGRHPGRKIFQAVRIFVNDELWALEAALEVAPKILSPGGSLFVVSYHSLEDRMVKHAMREWRQSKKGALLFKKPLQPDSQEIEENYKSRSAKLRVFRFSEMEGEGRK